jgi:L-methionine (R)-S-oxide reductase
MISLKGAQAIRKSKLFMALALSAKEILKRDIDRSVKLEAICNLLKNNVRYYNWVGFYAVDKERPMELVLVSYMGEPTQHVKIQFGKGICGQAAMLRKTLVVQDVSKEDNYLSCSSKVKSEIVVPIFRNKEIVGELDIDSHIASSFTLDDEAFLKEIAEMVSEFL